MSSRRSLGKSGAIGGFRIIDLIGRGGMSRVYRAHDSSRRTDVAVKVLDPFLAEDEAYRERFLRESAHAAALENEHVVRILGSGEDDGRLWIAMELVAGTDLGRILEEGAIDSERAIGILRDAAAGLDSAHAAGLVHRDVKPANILVGPGDAVKVTDFGIAQDAERRAGLTRTSAFVGTLEYAAPEQVRHEPSRPETDVYALGCVLYQALTGSLPFERATEHAIMDAHLHEPPPSISTARPGLPPSLDPVLRRSLAKHPDDRYPSCSELVEDAATALAGGSPIAAGMPAFATPPRTGATRLDLPAYAGDRRPTAASGMHRQRRWWALGVAVMLLLLTGAALGGRALLGGAPDLSPTPPVAVASSPAEATAIPSQSPSPSVMPSVTPNATASAAATPNPATAGGGGAPPVGPAAAPPPPAPPPRPPPPAPSTPAPTPQPQPNHVTFVALESPVTRGEEVTVRVSTLPHSSCTIVVTNPGGARNGDDRLVPKDDPDGNGMVTWRFAFPRSAQLGNANVFVQCTSPEGTTAQRTGHIKVVAG